jgi:hypothetical protein
MFNQTIKYTLLSLGILALSGCNQRTITIHPNENRQVQTPRVVYTQPSRPVIQEEILINRNPNLGSRVSSSVKNPSLGRTINSGNDNNSSHDDHYRNVDSEMEQDREVAPIPALIQRIAFPVEEYARLQKRGRSTVSGKIYLENSNSSEKIFGKKVKLYLNPVTSYSEQWYKESYLGGNKLTKADKRLYNYLKFTMSNESGSYNFFGVPRGEYYLVGTVKCAKECGFSEMKTVRLVQRISVGSGVTKVELMKNVP